VVMVNATRTRRPRETNASTHISVSLCSCTPVAIFVQKPWPMGSCVFPRRLPCNLADPLAEVAGLHAHPGGWAKNGCSPAIRR